MAFQGSLAELHLPDIIQLISVSGKTGVFHLTNGAQKGQIFLQDGKIVHAELEDATGEEAVYALAIWSQGDFRFEPGPGTTLRTITKSNTNLLMEAARRLDEWRVLSKKVPSVDWVPEFLVMDSREGQINLNTSEWMILSKLDGVRSVKSIAASSGLSPYSWKPPGKPHCPRNGSMPRRTSSTSRPFSTAALTGQNRSSEAGGQQHANDHPWRGRTVNTRTT